MNLARETLDKLKEYNKNPDSVMYVTDGKSYVWFDEFIAEAMRVNYDNGFGQAMINLNLVVVGDGWWLERSEYDGAEEWEYKEPPTKPFEHGNIVIVDADDWWQKVGLYK